jgi:hypothetical protein
MFYSPPPVHHQTLAIIRVDDTSSFGVGKILAKNGNTVLFSLPYSEGTLDAAKSSVLDAAASLLGVDPSTLKIAAISQTDSTVTAVIQVPSDTTMPPQSTETASSGTIKKAETPSDGSVPLSNWIMVVPITVDMAGIAIWDRTSPWADSWVTPQKGTGTWVVGVAGDSADISNITAEYLRHLSSASSTSPISYLFNKYSPKYIDLSEYNPRSGQVENFFYTTSGFSGTDNTTVSDADAATAATTAFITDSASNAESQIADSASNAGALSAPTPQGVITENVMGQEVHLSQTVAPPASDEQVTGPGFSIAR